MAYVYRHIRLDKNEPFYIGIGSDKTYKRANSNYGRNKIWNDIVAKTEYEVDILLDNIEWEYACQKEKEFIALYGKKNNNTGILANLTDGGDGVLGLQHSNKSKEKMRLSSTGRTHSTQTKLKISKNISGEKHHMFGKSPSEETKEKMRKSHIGHTHSIETRKKLSESHMGEKHHMFGKTTSEESKQKMRLAKLGKKASYETRLKIGKINLGKKFSEEHKKKISNAQIGRKKSTEHIKKALEAKKRNFLLKRGIAGVKKLEEFFSF